MSVPLHKMSISWHKCLFVIFFTLQFKRSLYSVSSLSKAFQRLWSAANAFSLNVNARKSYFSVVQIWSPKY